MDAATIKMHGCFLAAQLMWCFNISITRYAFQTPPLATLPPLIFALGRLTAAVALMTGITTVRTWIRASKGKPDPIALLPTSTWLCIYGLGIFMGLSNGAIVTGIHITDAASVGVIQCGITPLTCALAALVGIDRLPIGRIVSLVLLMAGDLLMARVWVVFHEASHLTYVWGCTLIFLNVVCYAVYLVLQRFFIQNIPTWDFIHHIFVSAVLTVYLWSLLFQADAIDAIPWETLPMVFWMILAYGGVNAILPNYLISTALRLKSSGAVVFALYYAIQPIVLTIAGFAFLGEEPSMVQFLGIGLSVSAIFINARYGTPPLPMTEGSRHPECTDSLPPTCAEPFEMFT